MTVKELIEQLQYIEDKDLPVYVYSVSMADIFPIEMVDLDISDRVDINIK